MALSDKEQRLLDQLEASLVEEDPKLASMMRGSHHRRPLNTRRVALGIIGFVIGMGLLIGGIQLHWAVSVVGFALMVVAATYGLGLWGSAGGTRARKRSTAPRSPRTGEDADPAGSTQIMDRFEERWRRRQSGDR